MIGLSLALMDMVLLSAPASLFSDLTQFDLKLLDIVVVMFRSLLILIA
jgi:hypothetical protein